MVVDPPTDTANGGVFGNPSPRWARLSLRIFVVTVRAAMMPATATSQPLRTIHTPGGVTSGAASWGATLRAGGTHEHRNSAGVVATLLVEGEEVAGGVEQGHRAVRPESETREWAAEPDVAGPRIVEVERGEG